MIKPYGTPPPQTRPCIAGIGGFFDFPDFSAILSPVSTPQPNTRKRNFKVALRHLLTQQVLTPEIETEQQPSIVVLHGYETYAGGRLGPLALAVCVAALAIYRAERNVLFILVGGWHLKEAGASNTIADAMALWLMENGVPKERVITQRGMSLMHFRPPRDTHEELALLRMIRRMLGLYGMNPFRFIAWEKHVPRIEAVQRTWKMRSTKAVPVTPIPHQWLWKRRATELCARIAQAFDPQGYGRIFTRIRRGRTIASEGIPLLET